MSNIFLVVAKGMALLVVVLGIDQIFIDLIILTKGMNIAQVLDESQIYIKWLTTFGILVLTVIKIYKTIKDKKDV